MIIIGLINAINKKKKQDRIKQQEKNKKGECKK
jgi:hypothetical protein